MTHENKIQIIDFLIVEKKTMRKIYLKNEEKLLKK